MRKVLSAIAITAITSTIATAAAADSMSMSGPPPMAMAQTYQFELASPVQSNGGKSVVAVRLIHVADKKAVIGAIIIESRADMGPIGMTAMAAPIKALPVTTPGVYSFEVANGSVWHKVNKWSLSFGAKVQGEAATVRGSVIVELSP